MQAVAVPYLSKGQTNFVTLLADLAVGGKRVHVPAGGVLYEPGDSADKLFYILEGQIRSHQISPAGSRRLVEILGEGDWCGAAALAGLAQYGERAEGATESVVAVIGVERFFRQLGEHPTAAAGLIRQLAGKLSAFREEAAGLIFDDCHKRLVRTLQRLSDSPAASQLGEGVCLRITHQQLAQAVGVARETISLALSDLRRKNLLRTGRKQLFFNPRKLEVVVGGN